MKPIRILGAGPSGLTAAINLAKSDYHVEVYERGSDAGSRFKGDLEALENWSYSEDFLESLRRMNIEVNFDADPFYRIQAMNGSRTYDVESKRPLFYMIKRGTVNGSLDQGLKKQALSLGVSLSLF